MEQEFSRDKGHDSEIEGKMQLVEGNRRVMQEERETGVTYSRKLKRLTPEQYYKQQVEEGRKKSNNNGN